MRAPSFLLAAASLLLFLAGCGESADTASTTGDAGGGGIGGTGSGGTAPATTPDAAFVPKPSGACPELVQGTISVAPDGKARDVKLWISEAAKTLDGPVVFFWHGAGGSPDEAAYALSSDVIQKITDQGGIVAAAVHDPGAGSLPWYLSVGGTDDADLRVMDEVLACAIEKVGVDLRRIHSVGFSAGAMNTAQVGFRRSGYIASVVTYSGAHIGSPNVQDESNLFPAMTFHGGPNDIVIIEFQTQTEAYVQLLKDTGHFSFICNHGKGHTVPADARASAWQFLEDHPFGASPEPYEKALPAGFPAYCSL